MPLSSSSSSSNAAAAAKSSGKKQKYVRLAPEEEEEQEESRGGAANNHHNVLSSSSSSRKNHSHNAGNTGGGLDDDPSSHNDNNNDHSETGCTNNEDAFQLPSTSTTTMTLISIDAGMEAIGMGLFQWLILAASGLCFASDAMQVILMSFLTVVLRQDWNLSDEAAAAATSALFGGAFFGTLALGPAADAIGRRPIFLTAASVISIFGLATAMSQNYAQLLVSVFGVGFGVGGLTVPFDVLAEFLPAAGRGTNLLMIEYFWTVGCLYVVVLAYGTLHGGENRWRLFVALCALPCMASLVIGYFFVPESARWLCAEGRTDEALDVLKKAAARNGLDPEQVFPPHVALRQEESEKDVSVSDLFKPEWREITLRLWGLWCASAFGYYGIILSTTRVFEDASSNGGDNAVDSMVEATRWLLQEEEEDAIAVTAVDSLGVPPAHGYSFDFGAIFVSSSAELVGITLVILLVDRVGRIPSQVWCYACAGVCAFALCSLASTGAPRLVLIGLGFCARVFAMGGTCTTWVSTAEVLTTEVRSTGHSTANAWGRIGATLCPLLVEGSTPLFQIGIIILIVNFFTVLCVYKLPETKGMEMGSTSERRLVDGEHSHSENSTEALSSTCIEEA